MFAAYYSFSHLMVMDHILPYTTWRGLSCYLKASLNPYSSVSGPWIDIDPWIFAVDKKYNVLFIKCCVPISVTNKWLEGLFHHIHKLRHLLLHPLVVNWNFMFSFLQLRFIIKNRVYSLIYMRGINQHVVKTEQKILTCD